MGNGWAFDPGAWAVAAASVLLAACGSTSGPSCTVGASQPCACTDGRMGAQVCQSDHTLGACVCTGGLDAGGSDVAFDAPVETGGDVPTPVDHATGETGACTGAICAGACVDPSSDPMHCGSCTLVCPGLDHGHATCASATCGVACDAGYSLVGSACVVVTTLGPPRPVAPLSVSTVTSRRPALSWQLAPATDGAHVQVCRDRACASLITEFDVAGSLGAPPSDLPTGIVFWRLAGRASGSTGSTYSPTWEFRVGAENAATSSVWGPVLDLNGDGYADLAVASSGGSGAPVAVKVYYGSAGGLGTAPSASLAAPSDVTTFGASLSSAGDLNGDGYADLAFGAFANSVFVYYGGHAGVAALPDVTLTGPTDSEHTGFGFGRAVVGAGDTDGDGYGELVVGFAFATGISSPPGAIMVFRGGPSGVTASGGVVMSSVPGVTGTLGATLAGGADLNGDGYADLALGAPDASSNTGAVAVMFGASTGLLPARSVWFAGPIYAGAFGKSLAIAGDVDGDGYVDLVVGAPGDGGSIAEAAYVFAGAAGTGFATTPSWTLPGPGGDVDFGAAVDGAGDLDGDGFDDLLIAAPSASGSTGRVYRYAGHAGAVPPASTSISAPDFNGLFGYSVAGIGDVDGDGRLEVAVGAPNAMSTAGAAYVFPGTATGVLGTTPSRTYAGSGTQALGWSVR